MSTEKKIEAIAAEIQKRHALVNDVVDPAERIVVDIAYPRLFSDLIKRYCFKAFDISGVRIHSNLRAEEDNLESLLRDKILTEAIGKAGFSPFGRPSGGGYDRVCFDLRDGGRPLDAAIIVLDHEVILSHRKIPKPRVLASGLCDLFQRGNSSE